MKIRIPSDMNHGLSDIMAINSGVYSPFITQLKMMTSPNCPEIYCVSCDYDILCFNERLFQHFGCLQPSSLHRAIKKRKAEYLAGRIVSMIALEHFCIINPQVIIGHNRAPIWPHEFLGSITHTDKKALALVGRKSHYKYVGIDCESFFSTETTNEVAQMILNLPEKAYLSGDAPFLWLLTLIFSAKEALFKALYPYALDHFDFDAAEISNICLQSKSFVLTLRTSLSLNLIKGRQLKGQFVSSRNTIVTYLYSCTKPCAVSLKWNR